MQKYKVRANKDITFCFLTLCVLALNKVQTEVEIKSVQCSVKWFNHTY